MNSISHKLKKVVGKAILFCKLTDFCYFSIKKVSTLRNLCNICNTDCFFFGAKRDVKPVQQN